jgi:hypothetical protein
MHIGEIQPLNNGRDRNDQRHNRYTRRQKRLWLFLKRNWLRRSEQVDKMAVIKTFLRFLWALVGQWITLAGIAGTVISYVLLYKTDLSVPHRLPTAILLLTLILAVFHLYQAQQGAEARIAAKILRGTLYLTTLSSISQRTFTSTWEWRRSTGRHVIFFLRCWWLMKPTILSDSTIRSRGTNRECLGADGTDQRFCCYRLETSSLGENAQVPEEVFLGLTQFRRQLRLRVRQLRRRWRSLLLGWHRLSILAAARL